MKIADYRIADYRIADYQRWVRKFGLIAAGAVICQIPAFPQEAVQNDVAVILEGKVVMPDGTPPPKSVGIERVCSDSNGTVPGPITNKQGHYTWSQRLSPATNRACFLHATMPGFISSKIDYLELKLSDFTASTNRKVLPDLVLSPRDNGAADNIVLVDPSEAPGKARAPYKEASKALDGDNYSEGIRQLELAVAAVPKFADGWSILGSLYERQGNLPKAKDALQHAIEVNPKLPAPYLRLARIANKLGEWDEAAKDEDSLLALEKRFYPEIYLHQAITRFEKNDLAGAEDSLKTALSLDGAHKMIRAEYVWGRIALAKGDVEGAKQHIGNYIKLDPGAADLSKITNEFAALGTPEATKTHIALERP